MAQGTKSFLTPSTTLLLSVSMVNKSMVKSLIILLSFRSEWLTHLSDSSLTKVTPHLSLTTGIQRNPDFLPSQAKGRNLASQHCLWQRRKQVRQRLSLWHCGQVNLDLDPILKWVCIMTAIPRNEGVNSVKVIIDNNIWMTCFMP